MEDANAPLTDTQAPSDKSKRSGLKLTINMPSQNQAYPRSADPRTLKNGNGTSPITPSPFNAPLSAYPRGAANDLLTLKISTKVPSGQITQHGAPLTPIQALAVVPPSTKVRRRQLSYMNSVESSGSYNATVEDWLSMRHEE